MRQQTQKPKIFFVGSALALSRPSLLRIADVGEGGVLKLLMVADVGGGGI